MPMLVGIIYDVLYEKFTFAYGASPPPSADSSPAFGAIALPFSPSVVPIPESYGEKELHRSPNRDPYKVGNRQMRTPQRAEKRILRQYECGFDTHPHEHSFQGLRRENLQ